MDGVGDGTGKSVGGDICKCCANRFEDGRAAKLLPCLHTHCMECLEQQQGALNQNESINTSASAGSRQVQCPTCKSRCPSDQVINSPFVRPAGDRHMHTDSAEKLCSSCNSCSLASVFCLNCNDYLCPSCVDAHKRVRLTKLHTLLKMTPTNHCEEPGSRISTTGVPYSCSLCNDSCLRKIRLFCQSCELPICITCRIQNHKDHDCCDIDDIISNSAGQIEALKKEIHVLKSKVKQVTDQNLVKKMSDKEKHIEEQKLRMAELRSNFEMCFAELQNFMDGVFDDQILEVRSRQKEVEQFNKKAAHTVNFVEQLLQTTDSMSVIAVRGLVSRNISTLQDEIVNTHKSCVIVPSIRDQVTNCSPADSEPTPASTSKSHLESRSYSVESVSSSCTHDLTHAEEIKQELFTDDVSEVGPGIDQIACTSSRIVSSNTPNSRKRSGHSARLAAASEGLDTDDGVDLDLEVKQEAESYSDSCTNFTEMDNDFSRCTSIPSARMDTPVIGDIRSCETEESGAGKINMCAADVVPNHTADQSHNSETSDDLEVAAGLGDDVETMPDTTQLGVSCPKKRKVGEDVQSDINSSCSEASTSSHDAELFKWNTIWIGQLEWQDRKAGKSSCRVTRRTPCHVSVREGTAPAASGSEWPPSVTMHLMKQSLLDSDTLRTHIKTSRRVQFIFHATDSPDYQKLEQDLHNGYAGFVNFPASGSQELRFLLLVYVAKKRAYFGLIPEDQKKAYGELKKMLKQRDESKHQVKVYKARHGIDGKFYQTGHDPRDPDDPWEDLCRVCQNGGELVLCDFCPRVYHRNCYVPELTEEPPSPWRCILCQHDLGLVDQSESVLPGYGGKITARKASDGMTDREVKICERILLELYCMEESIIFHKPVPRHNRDYHRLIKKPMDFATIKSRLTQGHPHTYTSIDRFLSDVKLVFANCYKFNVENRDIFKAGETTEELFKVLVLQYLPKYSPETT